MRVPVVLLLGLCAAGCSLFPEGEIVRLDGQAVSSYDVDRARNACSGDKDDMCYAALGYGSTRKEKAAAAQANLLQIAQENRQREEMARLAEETERKNAAKKLAAAKTKKHLASDKRAPSNSQYR